VEPQSQTTRADNLASQIKFLEELKFKVKQQQNYQNFNFYNSKLLKRANLIIHEWQEQNKDIEQ